MIKNVDLTTSYKVPKGKLKLTITIGEGQIGTSAVSLNGGDPEIGDIKNFELGNGPDLVGKTLSIKSVVTDATDLTNRTSIRYELKSGRTTTRIDQNATVEEEGASVIYRATFNLTS